MMAFNSINGKRTNNFHGILSTNTTSMIDKCYRRCHDTNRQLITTPHTTKNH